jgi:hypothetical protein
MQPLNHPWAYGRNSQTIHELVEWAGGYPKTLNRWIKERKLEPSNSAYALGVIPKMQFVNFYSRPVMTWHPAL